MGAATHIRLMRPVDAGRAREVINESFRRYLATIGLTPEGDDNPYDYLDEAIADARAWVAVIDDDIVGVAQVDIAAPGIWAIDLVGVLEPYAGRGIARQLMTRIEKDAHARGITGFKLITLEKIGWLWRFYESCGFTIIDRGPPPHGQDANTRVFMEKPLTD